MQGDACKRRTLQMVHSLVDACLAFEDFEAARETAETRPHMPLRLPSTAALRCKRRGKAQKVVRLQVCKSQIFLRLVLTGSCVHRSAAPQVQLEGLTSSVGVCLGARRPTRSALTCLQGPCSQHPFS